MTLLTQVVVLHLGERQEEQHTQTLYDIQARRQRQTGLGGCGERPLLLLWWRSRMGERQGSFKKATGRGSPEPPSSPAASSWSPSPAERKVRAEQRGRLSRRAVWHTSDPPLLQRQTAPRGSSCTSLNMHWAAFLEQIEGKMHAVLRCSPCLWLESSFC